MEPAVFFGLALLKCKNGLQKHYAVIVKQEKNRAIYIQQESL
jgi:hypothetical protein